MPPWKPIVGKPFTAPDFRKYVAKQSFMTWRPRFVVVHNTAIPSFAKWHDYTGEQRMRGLEHFYRDERGWSAGPHLFVADDFIWVFTPLITSGVHSPSWNSFSWGVEVVGDYETEALSPPVEANVIDAIATLHAAAGLDPQGMRAHREDPLTTHQCPGRHLDVAHLRDQVRAELARRIEGDHTPDERSEAATAAVAAAGKTVRRKAKKKNKRKAARAK
jgi:hypothetical protein